MIVAIDVSSNSAQRAFDLSAAAITGKSTHRLVSGPAGVDQQLYVDLRRHGYDFSAPVIEGYVLARGLGNRAMQFMGTDPFAESAFRSPLWSNQNIAELGGFLTRPNGVVLSRQVAQKYGLAVGDRIALQVKGAPTTVTLVGLLTPADEVSNQKLSDLIIADISTAQELFHMPGRLSHIDLIIKDEATATRIQQRLPAGVRMETSDTQRDTVKQMTDAFTVNLTALSLIALLVGIFLIYNTVTFNVVQRRPFFAILRCLGVTREQLFWLIMTESEPPRHVRRLQFLERMGSCQVVHRGGTRRSCVSGRCGWSQRSAVSTIRSGQRSVRSPVYLVLAARRRCVSGCARRRSMPAHGPGPRPKNPLS